MGRFKDTFLGFDQDEYYAELERLSEASIRQEHKIIRRRVIGAGTQAGLGFGAAIATSGVSIVVGGIGARRTSVNRQKRKLIEQRMRFMNWSIDDLELNDVLIGAGPGLIAAAVAPGAEHVIGHFAGHGASEMVTQYAPETLRAAVDAPVQFANFAEYGVRAQLEAVSHGIIGNASHLVPHTGAEYLASATGYAGASTAEAKAADMAAKGLVEYGLKKRWRSKHTDSASRGLVGAEYVDQLQSHAKLGLTNGTFTPLDLTNISSSGSVGTKSVRLVNGVSSSSQVLGLAIYNILTLFPVIGHLCGLKWVWILCIAWLTLAMFKPPKVSPAPVVANLIWLVPGAICSSGSLKPLWFATSSLIFCIGISEFLSTSPERPRASTTIAFVLFSAAAGVDNKEMKELLQVLFLISASCSWTLLSITKVKENYKVSVLAETIWATSAIVACTGVIFAGAVLVDLVF